MNPFKIAIRALGVAFAFSFATAAFAQGTPYPTKPIKIIVGFAPGGGSDFIARVVAQKLTERLGQPVIVDNTAGAGGNVAAHIALKAPPDGYTLFRAAASYTVNPVVYKLTVDPIKDMTPIAQLARGRFCIAINPQFKAN